MLKASSGAAARLETPAVRAALMRAFEHEAHLALRRTDLSLAEKRRCVADAQVKYGFSRR